MPRFAGALIAALIALASSAVPAMAAPAYPGISGDPAVSATTGVAGPIGSGFVITDPSSVGWSSVTATVTTTGGTLTADAGDSGATVSVAGNTVTVTGSIASVEKVLNSQGTAYARLAQGSDGAATVSVAVSPSASLTIGGVPTFFFNGNGHYYQVDETLRTYSAASTAAQGSTLAGAGGYLAVVRDEAEDDFVRGAILAGRDTSAGPEATQVRLGAERSATAFSSPCAGVGTLTSAFAWTPGPNAPAADNTNVAPACSAAQSGWTPWYPGQPSNGTGEAWMSYFFIGGVWRWHDALEPTAKSLREYGDTTSYTPASTSTTVSSATTGAPVYPGITGGVPVSTQTRVARAIGTRFAITDPSAVGWSSVVATVTTSRGTLTAAAGDSGATVDAQPKTVTITGSIANVEKVLNSRGTAYVRSLQNTAGAATITVSVRPASTFTAGGVTTYFFTGNGHYYRVDESLSTYATANAAAQGSRVAGALGYLAAVGDSAEDDFVRGTILAGRDTSAGPEATQVRLGAVRGATTLASLGCPAGAGALTNAFAWAPGANAPAADTTNVSPACASVQSGWTPWYPGEPQNSGTENWMSYFFIGGVWRWHDSLETSTFSLREYGNTTSFTEASDTARVTAVAPAAESTGTPSVSPNAIIVNVSTARAGTVTVIGSTRAGGRWLTRCVGGTKVSGSTRNKRVACILTPAAKRLLCKAPLRVRLTTRLASPGKPAAGSKRTVRVPKRNCGTPRVTG